MRSGDAVEVVSWRGVTKVPCDLCGSPMTDGEKHSLVIRVATWNSRYFFYHEHCLPFSPYAGVEIRRLSHGAHAPRYLE